MKITFTALLAVFLFPQARALDALEYKFTNSYRYALLEDTSTEQFKGQYVVTASLAHISSPFFIENSANGTLYQEIVSKYDLLSLGASYRVNLNLQLKIETAIVNATILTEKETAVADTHVKGKYLVWENKSQAFSIVPEIIFATGSELAFTTRSDLGGAIRGTYEHHLTKLHFVTSLGFDHGEENSFYSTDNTNKVLAEFGLSYDLAKNWNINFESIHNFTSKLEAEDSDFYLTLKNKSSKNFSSYAGLGIAGIGEPDKLNKTIFLGFKYHLGPTPKQTVLVEKIAIVEKPVEIKIVPIKSKAEEKAKYGSNFQAENLYFENGKTTLTSTYFEKVAELSKSLNKKIKRVKNIVIEGFASSVGNPTSNQSLSMERAYNAKNELIRNGIPEEILTTVGYGDKSNTVNESEDRQRRVQFRIYFYD